MEIENEISNNTEKLNEIDVSVLAQPSIRKSKANAKKQKEEELREAVKTYKSVESPIGKDKLKDDVVTKLPSTTLKEKRNGKQMDTQKSINNKENDKNLTNTKRENVNKENKEEKHIALMQGESQYNLKDDLNKNFAEITFGQLLDICPKLRAQLNKALRLKNLEPIEEGFEEVVFSTISKEDIATTVCKINGIKGFAFLDTCASINIVSRSFLNNLHNIEPFGYTTNNIIQITSKTKISSELYILIIEFEKLTIKAVFRVIDDNQGLFDILIGYNTLRDNKLFINPLDNYLCKMNDDESWVRITPLSSHNNEHQDEEHLKEIKDSLLFCFINEDEEVKCNNQEKEVNDKIMSLEEKKNEILINIINDAPKKIRKKLKNLFDKYIKFLAIDIEELGSTKLLPHSIQLQKDTMPIKQKAYRLSKVQADGLKSEIQKLLENKLIEPSCSPWSSPVILVPKKNKKWRMCVDFRKLNNVTVKDAYGLPIIDDILFSIGRRVKYFTTIDLFSGFHQIPMNPRDIPKTSFTTSLGNYQFRVMPFGLCNAPRTFQREMNRIFFPLIGKCLFVYIDDLIVFSESLEDHLNDLGKVFEILKENGLKLNLEKCNFFKDKVELLGHTVSTEGISPLPSKIKVIAEWLPPTTVTQLQSFLGAIGYYRKFIYNFATIAKPLFKLLKKNVEYKWGKSENNSFEELKQRMITAPILIMPDFNKQFIIRTDASYDGIGGVLLQKDEENRERPIHYISRSLKPPELNYGITDLEGTAAAYCTKKFKAYIGGNPYNTLLYTDHKPLVGLFKNKETNNARQARWVILLSMLKVEVIYEPGKKNVVADALSRLKVNHDHVVSMLLPELTIPEDDKLISVFKEKFVKINEEEYYVDNNNFRRIIKDEKQKINLILQAHNIGHEGVFKTYNRLKRDYYWPNMALDVRYMVTTCKRCQLFKPHSYNSFTEDIATNPSFPFVRVGLDIVGPLPVTSRGNQYIIVLVDYMTKWVEAEPTQSIESNDVIYFLSKVFSRHGTPEILVTDNGPQFRSEKTKAFLDLYGVYVHYTTVYHPESNGMVENRNKEIGKYLRILCNKNTQNWDEVLPSALWALRTCKNETTKFSSFELLYGRRDLQPFELTLNLDKQENYESKEEYFIRKFARHHQWIKEAIENIQTANRIWEDRRKQMKRLKANYQSGDLVLIRYINRRKLDPYFLGPLKIVKKEFNTVTVCDPITNEIAERNVHLKNVIPYKLCQIPTSGDEV